MIDMLTAEQLRANMQASIAVDAPAMSTSKDTDEGVLVEQLVDSLIGLQHQTQTVEYDAIPGPNTSTEALDRHADAHFEGGRIAAQTTDVIAESLRCSGTEGAVIPANTALVHVDGTRYKTPTGGVIDVDGTVDVDCQSISTGSICNKSDSETLQFETPPTGIDATATLVDDLSGATDQESDAHLLNRIIDVIRNPHAGGRASDYRQWAMEVPRVDRVFVYCPSSSALNGRRGKGTTDIAVLVAGSAGDRRPSTDLVALVTTKIESMRPTGARDHLELRPALVTQAFDVKLSPDPGYEFDWDAGSTSYTVASWTPGTKTLQWSATVPASVHAGCRLLVYGLLVDVVSVSGDKTVISGDNSGLPGVSSGEHIYPAGPLTQPAIDAIKAYCDGLGPARGVAADPEQPDWDDTIRVMKIAKSLLLSEGVRDVDVITPSGNVAPTDHVPSGTVDLLIYGLIEVRPL